MAKITVEVVGKAITGADRVWDVALQHILVESKAKVVDEGEEHFDEIGEGQVRVLFLEEAPK